MSNGIFSDEEKEEIRQEIIDGTINNIFSDNEDVEIFKEQLVEKIVEKTIDSLGINSGGLREEFIYDITVQIANKTFESVLDGNEHILFNSIASKIAKELFKETINGEDYQDPSQVIKTFANQITRNFIDKLQKK